MTAQLDLRIGRKRRDAGLADAACGPLYEALRRYAVTHATVRADEFQASLDQLTWETMHRRPNAMGAAFRAACVANWLRYEKHVASGIPSRRGAMVKVYHSLLFTR